MNRYKLFKAGINVNDGVERLNHDKERYEELLCRFFGDPHYALYCEGGPMRNEKGEPERAH